MWYKNIISRLKHIYSVWLVTSNLLSLDGQQEITSLSVPLHMGQSKSRQYCQHKHDPEHTIHPSLAHSQSRLKNNKFLGFEPTREFAGAKI